ncbi:hypothetical protein LXL04_032005 [Taraxacum kok-saghyz]
MPIESQDFDLDYAYREPRFWFVDDADREKLMLVQVRTIIKFENGGTNLDRYKSHYRRTLKWMLIDELDAMESPFYMEKKEQRLCWIAGDRHNFRLQSMEESYTPLVEKEAGKLIKAAHNEMRPNSSLAVLHSTKRCSSVSSTRLQSPHFSSCKITPRLPRLDLIGRLFSRALQMKILILMGAVLDQIVCLGVASSSFASTSFRRDLTEKIPFFSSLHSHLKTVGLLATELREKRVDN